MHIAKIQLDTTNGKTTTKIVEHGKRKPMPVGLPVSSMEMGKEVVALRTKGSGLLPPAIRWISFTGRQLIFERPPRIVKIQYNPVGAFEAQKGDWKTFALPLPWTVYAINLTQSYELRHLMIFGRPTKLSSMGDYVGLLPLPNIYNDGRFCLPGSDDYDDDDYDEYEDSEEDWGGASAILHQANVPTLGATIEAAYHAIWSSGFNHDLWDLPTMALTTGALPLLTPELTPYPDSKDVTKLLERWEKLSLQDVTHMNWMKRQTLSQVVGELHNFANQLLGPYSFMTSVYGAGVRASLNTPVPAF